MHVLQFILVFITISSTIAIALEKQTYTTSPKRNLWNKVTSTMGQGISATQFFVYGKRHFTKYVFSFFFKTCTLSSFCFLGVHFGFVYVLQVWHIRSLDRFQTFYIYLEIRKLCVPLTYAHMPLSPCHFLFPAALPQRLHICMPNDKITHAIMQHVCVYCFVHINSTNTAESLIFYPRTFFFFYIVVILYIFFLFLVCVCVGFVLCFFCFEFFDMDWCVPFFAVSTLCVLFCLKTKKWFLCIFGSDNFSLQARYIFVLTNKTF
uniref:Uncharacterized protein n=1 Tax=Ditylum brightwellii TaxID=49249 RepID=A0A7S4VI66_9STRA